MSEFRRRSSGVQEARGATFYDLGGRIMGETTQQLGPTSVRRESVDCVGAELAGERVCGRWKTASVSGVDVEPPRIADRCDR